MRDLPVVRTAVAVPFRYPGGDASAFSAAIDTQSWTSRDGKPAKVWGFYEPLHEPEELSATLRRLFVPLPGKQGPWTVTTRKLAAPFGFLRDRIHLEEAEQLRDVRPCLRQVSVRLYPAGVGCVLFEWQWDDLAEEAGAPGAADVEHLVHRVAERVQLVRRSGHAPPNLYGRHWRIVHPRRGERGADHEGETQHEGLREMWPLLHKAFAEDGACGLVDLAGWLVNLRPDAFAETPKNLWTLTSVSWPGRVDADRETIAGWLFQVARGAPKSQLPPRDDGQHVWAARANRYFGTWREGTAALNWTAAGKPDAFEMASWPKRLSEVYLQLGLYAVAEREALEELGGQLAVQVRDVPSKPEEATDAILDGLLVELRDHVRFTVGFTGEDSGGNTDIAEFFVRSRQTQRTPAVLAEYRAEVTELLRYVDVLYERRQYLVSEARRELAEQEQRDRMDEAARDREFQTLVGRWGVGAGTAAVLTGVFGMNLEFLAESPPTIWSFVAFGMGLLALAVALSWGIDTWQARRLKRAARSERGTLTEYG